MADLLILDNFPPANIAETSKLHVDAAALATTFTVENPNDFAVDKHVVVGRLGNERAEVRKITNVTDSVITVAALDFAHERFEPVTILRGPQIKVYRAADVDGTPPVDGSFASIATVTIEPDKQFSEHSDSGGGSGFWYKQTFFNTDLSAETTLGASTAVRGGDFGHFATVVDIRREAGFDHNPDITDENIADRRDEAEGEVKGALLNGGYGLPFTRVPPIVRNVTKLLAAGYLLLQDYGEVAEGTNKEGNAKIKQAERILDKIIKHEVVLTDTDDSALAHTPNIDAWPTDATETAESDEAGGNRIFRVTDPN